MSAPIFSASTRLTRDSALALVPSSKKATFACWFNADAGNGGVILSGGPSAFSRFQISLNSTTGKLSLVLRDSAAALIYAASTNTAFDDSAWHHVVISIDLSATTVSWKVDRSSPALTITTPAANVEIDIAGATQWKVGNTFNNGGVNYAGALYDLLFKVGVFVDITDVNELEKFVSSDGRAASGNTFFQNVGPNPGIKPIGYGHQARDAFGGEPADIYFSGVFQDNKGTAGPFVLSGTFTAEEDPDVYRAAAHYDNKERWFDSELTGFSYTRSKTFIEQRDGHPKKGLRMGVDEMDERFRQEEPSYTYHQLLFNDREDDTEEWDR